MLDVSHSAKEEEIKPGIGCHTEESSGARLTEALRLAGKGLRPVDPAQSTVFLSVRVSPELRTALEARAQRERKSASVYVRRLLADALEVTGTRDRLDGRRFVDEDVERACALLDRVGMLIENARLLPPETPLHGVLAALEGAHTRVIGLIERAEACDRVSAVHAGSTLA